MKSDWLYGLNSEQVEVVKFVKGSAVVLAGAGSGKSRCLVHRVGALTEHTEPHRILAVTFSKKAADEMTHRAEVVGIKTGPSGARFGTWHSLCFQILRDSKRECATWTIDTKNQYRICIDQALGHEGLNWSDVDVSQFVNFIRIAKASALTPDASGALDLAEALFPSKGGTLAKRAVMGYEMAEARRVESKLLTFDDMLLEVFKLFHTNLKGRAYWQAKWDYILQDEAQDSSPVQNYIAMYLSEQHQNYMAIGDPQQAIFGFRGADVDYFSGLTKNPVFKTFTLRSNYRCSVQIVSLANKVVSDQEWRLPEGIVPVRENAGSVECREFPSTEAMTHAFLNYIAVRRGPSAQIPARYCDFAVLYRTNAQSRAYEDVLLAAKIPYVVVGGFSFYERKEVKSLLGYLRTVSNINDIEAVRACLNAPTRYLGRKFLDLVYDFRFRDRTSAWAVLIAQAAALRGVNSRQRDAANELSAMLDVLSQKGSPREALDYVCECTSYLSWVDRKSGDKTGENSPVANVEELLEIASQFTDINQFLLHVDNAIEVAKKSKDEGPVDAVQLMTIHAAKGLEWKHVWLTGCIDGLMPLSKSTDAAEELRLFYVAVTRAKDSLVCAYVKDPKSKRGGPSPYLAKSGLVAGKEIPAVDC